MHPVWPAGLPVGHGKLGSMVCCRIQDPLAPLAMPIGGQLGSLLPPLDLLSQIQCCCQSTGGPFPGLFASSRPLATAAGLLTDPWVPHCHCCCCSGYSSRSCALHWIQPMRSPGQDLAWGPRWVRYSCSKRNQDRESKWWFLNFLLKSCFRMLILSSQWRVLLNVGIPLLNTTLIRDAQLPTSRPDLAHGAM